MLIPKVVYCLKHRAIPPDQSFTAVDLYLKEFDAAWGAVAEVTDRPLQQRRGNHSANSVSSLKRRGGNLPKRHRLGVDNRVSDAPTN